MLSYLENNLQDSFFLVRPAHLLASLFLWGRIRLSGTFWRVLWDSEVYALIFQGGNISFWKDYWLASCWTKNLKFDFWSNKMSISPLKNFCGISKLRRFGTMKLSITTQRQAVGTLLPGDALCLKQLCPVSGWSQLNVSFCKARSVEFLLVCVFCFWLFTHVLSTWGGKGSVYQPVVRYSIRLCNDWLQSSWQDCEQTEQAAHPCSLS